MSGIHLSHVLHSCRIQHRLGQVLFPRKRGLSKLDFCVVSRELNEVDLEVNSYFKVVSKYCFHHDMYYPFHACAPIARRDNK